MRKASSISLDTDFSNLAFNFVASVQVLMRGFIIPGQPWEGASNFFLKKLLGDRVLPLPTVFRNLFFHPKGHVAEGVSMSMHPFPQFPFAAMRRGEDVLSNCCFVGPKGKISP